MTTASRINRSLAWLRAARGPALLARGTILLAGAVALLVEVAQPWDAMDAVVLVTVVVLPLAVLAPDSPAPLGFVVLIVLGWLSRAPSAPGWPVVEVALALLVLHLAAAFAGQFPADADTGGAVLRRWLPAATTAGVLTVVVAGLGGVLRGSGVEGSLGVTVAALLGLSAVLWLVARSG